jgi:hypothetical protein
LIDTIQPIILTKLSIEVYNGQCQLRLQHSVAHLQHKEVLIDLEPCPDLADSSHLEGANLVTEGLNAVSDHHLPAVPASEELRLLE